HTYRSQKTAQNPDNSLLSLPYSQTTPRILRLRSAKIASSTGFPNKLPLFFYQNMQYTGNQSIFLSPPKNKNQQNTQIHYFLNVSPHWLKT
ncbi:hypothetical protein, partial [Olivibacter ginsenosidimutans]|uniref:hypothetical protein n=1 Tax=Olivibacter ginsenosidimutans TaxID=1176537 RepID=UPI0031EA8C7E